MGNSAANVNITEPFEKSKIIEDVANEEKPEIRMSQTMINHLKKMQGQRLKKMM